MDKSIAYLVDHITLTGHHPDLVESLSLSMCMDITGLTYAAAGSSLDGFVMDRGL